MQGTNGILPGIDSKYFSFNMSVTVCRLSLIMILLIELFQLNNSSIYALEEENITIYH